jgi:hypothetical protein
MFRVSALFSHGEVPRLGGFPVGSRAEFEVQEITLRV